MGRDTIQLEDTVSTIFHEYLLEFTSEYGITESLHPELPGPEEPIVDFSEGKVTFTIPLPHPWSLPNSPFTTVSDIDLFSWTSAPNPAKVKTGTRPCAAHKVPLLTGIASRVIDMEDMTSTLGGKSLVPMGLDTGSTISAPATQDAPTATKSVSGPDLLSYARSQPPPEQDIAQSSRKTAAEIPTRNVATTEVQGLFSTESPKLGKSISFPSRDGSPGGIYQPGWGVTNNCRLDTPNAYQDMVDHIVATGSQLRLRFEQEVRLLKKAKSKIARRDQRIQAREEEVKKLDQKIKSLRVVEAEVHGLRNQTRNLETLLEADVDIKKAAEAKYNTPCFRVIDIVNKFTMYLLYFTRLL
nr:hypothetical protein [Tanacetum cinerariifolium]